MRVTEWWLQYALIRGPLWELSVDRELRELFPNEGFLYLDVLGMRPKR